MSSEARRAASKCESRHEADTQEHEEGIIGHGDGNAYVLKQLLQDGYRPERPSWNLEYTTKLSVDLYELFLDGLDRRSSDFGYRPERGLDRDGIQQH